MKKYFKRLNQIGAAHLLAPLIVTALVAGVGVYVLNKSHAAVPYTTTPLAYSYNAGDYPATQYLNTTTATGTNTVTQASQKQDKYLQSNAAYNKDGTYLAFMESAASGGNSLWIKAVKTPNVSPLRIYTKGLDGVLGNSPLVWSSDSKKIIVYDEAYSSTKYAFKSVDVATGAVSLLAIIDKKPAGSTYDGWVGRYDLLGDGVTLVYSFSDGAIYSVKSGGTPTVVRGLNNNYCELIGRRPGTTTEFAYTCWISNSNKLYTKTLAGAERLVYETPTSSWANGARNKYMGAVTWSPGGSTLGMRFTDELVLNVDQCAKIHHNGVAKVAATGGALMHMAWLDDGKSYTGCGGMGGASYGNSIVWNSSNYLGVISDGTVKVVGATTPYNVTNVFTAPAKSYVTGLAW